jgi:sugar/nucleoside kinase (ribokinase family)
MKTVSDYDIVVMGDINLDWCSRDALSFPFSELIVNGIIEWTPIDEMPGGSGLNFACFAQEEGFRPLLLGKIGNDPAGKFIYKWLQQRRLELGVVTSTSLGTGKAFIARDKNDIRFLVNNRPNANRALSVSDVERHAHVIETCRMLYVSGYCAMYPEAPRTQAASKAMELARKGSETNIVFDVVPHQFYKIYAFSQFLDLTRDVDILISEVATMRRFLDMGDRSEMITRAMAEQTAERLMEFFDQFVLRFGPSGCDEQVIWNAKSKEEMLWEETEHYRAQDKRGYGDQLTIRTLRDIFEIAPMHNKTL